MSKPRVLILGLDGLDPLLVERFAANGALPNLSRLMTRGVWGPLRSTTPATTLPAWTSFLTGASPSFHGVPDFTMRLGYSVQFVGAGHRELPTVFEHLEARGLTTGAAWFPATFPPTRLRGYMISGWDSPVTSAGDESFVWPRVLHAELDRNLGGAHLLFDAVDEFADETSWYLRAAKALRRSVRRRMRVARYLLERHRVDVAAFYFGETDTAAHHYWAFHDPGSPRRPASFEPALANVIRDTYHAVDEAVGELVTTAGEQAAVVVLSDHGSGGSSDLAIHLNRMLEQAGLLRFGGGPSMLVRPRFLRGVAPSMIPPRLRRAAFRLAGGLAPALAESMIRFGGIDWSRTRAFSEELSYAPAVWINQRGRDPGGVVPVAGCEAVVREVEAASENVTAPDGSPLIRRVWRRDELYPGPQSERFPDLVLELERPGGYIPACLPSQGRPGEVVSRLSGKELLGRKGRSLPGCHTPLGTVIVAAEGLQQGRVEGARLEHVAPVVAALAGVEAAGWFEAEPPAPLPRPASATGQWSPEAQHRSAGPESYDAEEERIVAERLRALGYLE